MGDAQARSYLERPHQEPARQRRGALLGKGQRDARRVIEIERMTKENHSALEQLAGTVHDMVGRTERLADAVNAFNRAQDKRLSQPCA